MRISACIIAALTLLLGATHLCAQTDKKYKVEGGVMQLINEKGDTVRKMTPTSSLIPVDTTKKLSKRELREQERAKQDADTSFHRYSRLFRDTLPISRVCAISLVAPGFGQLYNKQAWKMPILYATVGTALYFGLKENCKYQCYKEEYEGMLRRNASREEIDPVQANMIRRNTTRQLLYAGAIGAYIYFVGDAALNYQGKFTSVKKATTLSTICPGAGQIYNKSYRKVPIVIGGFATMAYVFDWNNRGYQRFKLAYDILTDGNPETVDEFNGRYSPEFIRNMRNSFRRSRDMSIILTAALYVLNIVDAHVDAQLKDYDISDDLANVTLEPAMNNLYTRRTGNTNMIGFALNVRF